MSRYIKAEDVIKCVAQYIMTDAKRDNPYVCGDIEDYIELTEAILTDLPTIEVSEDAISREYLKSFEYINKGDFNSVETIREWIDNAPSVIPQVPNEDAISREWLKGHIEKVSYKNEWHMTETDEFVSWENIEKAPSVVPSRAEGEWVEIDDTTISCRCSVCGWEAHLYEDDVYGMPYCPDCGAKMKG